MPARSKKNHHPKKSHYLNKKNGPNPPKGASKTGSFRVIGGSLRSRRFEFPAVEGLRPTTDRVKETVFNWLQPYIAGAKVLDLFAGSGSLAFEAISREADYVLMLEKNPAAAAAIAHNLSVIQSGPTQAQVKCSDSFQWLDKDETDESSENGFEIVFIDPPFRKSLLESLFNKLEPYIRSNALIYVEREKELVSIAVPENWHLLKEKNAGQVTYQLYQYTPQKI